MKKMIRTAAAFMLCFCIIFLVSCASAVENPEIVPEYETEYAEEDIDLNGYEYVIRSYSAAMNPNVGDSASGDKILQRYRDAEKKFNITITPYNGVDVGTVFTYYASGLNYVDLFYDHACNVTQPKYLQEGYLNSFTAMGLDFDSGMYGTENVLLANTFKGEVYGIVSYFWNIPVSMNQPAMWFNPVVLNNFNQPSPHELDENGKWTWDALKQICYETRDTSDPDKNMHIYALCYTSEPYLEMAAIFSNNGRFIEPDENGRLKYALNSPNVLEALDYIRGLAEEGLISDGGDRQNITPFVEDRRAFFLEFSHLGVASESQSYFSYQMQHAYEWINFPRGPRGDENTLSTSYSYYSTFFYSPISSPMEVNAVVIPYLFQPLPGCTEENYLDEFKSVNFYTDESFEYYERIRANAFFDYTVYAPYPATLISALGTITRGMVSASEKLSSIEGNVQATLDNLYNNYLDN